MQSADKVRDVNLHFFHEIFTMPLIWQNLYNYLALARSHDVIGHVTVRLPIPHFILVLHCDQAPISSPFADVGP